ncbi:2-amino-3-ketobutyrate coenzyme A ligase, mitochondrial-like [Convolutriloba macropyga]|uniref:2-amino-3-ketobutyrate coenzyme A ligase, mitochondrial-like n=1 Tax=Convolutriloba macropyga TaxID=536237 RepID=UPI003F526D37
MMKTSKEVVKLLCSSVQKNTLRGSKRALSSWADVVQSELESIREAGTWKTERVITSSQSAQITVASRKEKVLNFCANNYLGLSDHPQVVQAAIDTLKSHGSGLSSVRFICGTQDIHKQLEASIANFHEREDAIIYASCFDANAGIFETLLGPEDAVFSDELNHASIIDGIRLCKAKKFKYEHRNMTDLDAKLSEASDQKIKLIVTDGVFSMDGNIAPLGEICDVAEKHNAVVLIDECHATGFLGATGRGTEEFLGIGNRVQIVNSTLGKAIGGAAGGYTCGPKFLIDLLRQRSRPYLFSNTLPPAVVGSALKSFELIDQSPDIIQSLQENTKKFRSEMKSNGFTILGDEHPICPVFVGDAKLANQMASSLLERGIYVIGFSYPVVPIGKARIRVQISGGHSKEDILTAVEAFKEVGKEFNVI